MEMSDRSSLTLRLPAGMKDWLSKEARANGGSQNAEIIRSIRERMVREAAGDKGSIKAPAASGNTGGLQSAGNVNRG